MAIPRLSNIPGVFTAYDIAERYHMTRADARSLLERRVANGQLVEYIVEMIGDRNRKIKSYAYQIPDAKTLDWKCIDHVCKKRVQSLADVPLLSYPATVQEYRKFWNMVGGTSSRIATLMQMKLLKAIGGRGSIGKRYVASTSESAYDNKTLLSEHYHSYPILKKPSARRDYMKFWGLSVPGVKHRLRLLVKHRILKQIGNMGSTVYIPVTESI